MRLAIGKVMNTSRWSRYRNSVKYALVVALAIYGLQLGFTLWNNRRIEMLMRSDLHELFLAAMSEASSSHTGNFVANVGELVANESLSPDRAARIEQRIVFVRGLSIVSDVTLPLAYSKEPLHGRFAVVKVSGKIVMMTAAELAKELKRVADAAGGVIVR